MSDGKSPKEPLRCKETLAPGVWVDENNQLHVSISDILDEFDLPHTDENKAEVEKIVQEMVSKYQPGIKFVAVGACPNCGIGDGEKHKEGCPLRG